jgi:hypothetical protein
MTQVASDLGMSDRGLAKVCERHKIPSPGRGYWRRLETGKRVSKEPLPTLSPKEAHLETILLAIQTTEETTGASTGMTVRQKQFEADPRNRIEVVETVGRYHPLVRQTRKALLASRKKARGYDDASDVPRLAVDVEPANERRALLILDALLKGLELRCFSVHLKETGTHGSHETCVLIEDIEIPLRLKELSRQVNSSPGDAGQFSLEILWGLSREFRRSWNDGKRQRVEDLLNDFVIGLVRAAEAKRRWEQEWEENRRRREAEENARRLRERELALESARSSELRRQAVAWEDCQRLRAYIAAVKEAAAQEGEIPRNEALDAWLTWAEGYVEQHDPLQRIADLPFDPEKLPDHELRSMLESDGVTHHPARRHVADTFSRSRPSFWANPWRKRR